MFERVNVVGSPNGLRNGVPNDWSSDWKGSVTELSSSSWYCVVAAAGRTKLPVRGSATDWCQHFADVQRAQTVVGHVHQ